MDTGAFDFLLLMTNLSQLKDRATIERLFLEGIRELFPVFHFDWAAQDTPESDRIDVRTRKASFGAISYRISGQVDPRVLPLVQNAGQMLALVLENLLQEEALVQQNRQSEALAKDLAHAADQLESRVRERTSDLAEAIRSLSDSRQALEALNAELEQRVRDRTAEIERSRAASEAFAYTVSHDLRAPLRAIDGYAKALMEDHGHELPGSAAEYLERIVSRARRMGRLIDALLGLGRMDRHPVRLESVDLNELVGDVVEEVRGPRLATDRSATEARWILEPLPRVETDPDLAKQVVANLVANAHKFSSHREDPTISIRSMDRPDGTWVEVRDNGEGFDGSQVADLFLPFHRLHGETFEGIGIGLATVKTILDRLGGAIEVDAAQGNGATFRIRLAPPSAA